MKSFRLKPSRKLSVFIVCLVIASFFWLLNQLTKEYRINVYVPLRYSNIPSDKVITNYLPEKLQLDIEGDGFNLLSVDDESEFDSVNVDLRSLRFRNFGDKQRAVISTQYIRDKVEDQLGNKIKIQQISLDTIAFTLEEKMRKQVPVQLNVVVNTNQQYLIKGTPEYQPQTVELIGPASKVNAIDEVKTEYKSFEDVQESLEGEVALIPPHVSVKMNFALAEYKIEVEGYTEKEIELPITIIHLPDSIRLNTYPSQVKVKYRVGLSQYEKYGENALRAVVDYKEIEKDHPSRVKVSIDQSTDKIDLMLVSPERVEYIIRK